MGVRRLALELLMLISIPAADTVKITCNSPSVREGEEATVTCSFNRDIRSLSTASVTVEHYPQNSDKPVSLLECTPIRRDCQPAREGYAFDGNYDTKLVLKILKASKQHEGRFLCKMLSPDLAENDEVVPCSFTLNETVPKGKPENTTTSLFSLESNGDLNIGLVIGVVVAAIAVVVIIGLIIVVIRKRSNPDNANDSRIPLNAEANQSLATDSRTDPANGDGLLVEKRRKSSDPEKREGETHFEVRRTISRSWSDERLRTANDDDMDQRSASLPRTEHEKMLLAERKKLKEAPKPRASMELISSKK